MLHIQHHSRKELIYILLLITPIIDNINGLFIMNHGATGISIGTFFRILIILYCVAISYKIKKYFITIYLMLYFPLLAFIKGMFGGGMIDNLTYAMKWVMVVLIILALSYKALQDKDTAIENVNDVIVFWSWIVPGMLILEYVFNIGIKSYWDAGFKGLYYSTNDLAYVLTILFIYSAYQLIYHFKVKWIISISLNGVAILILGTKSSVAFSVFTLLLLFLFHVENPIAFIKKFFLAIIVITFLHLVMKYMGQNINDFVNRYTNMWLDSQNGGGFWDSFMNFATSGRTQRIAMSFSQINNGNYFVNFLFGWIKPDNANVVEMDFDDLFFQYGMVGFSLLVWFYLSFAHLRSKKAFILKYIMIVSIIYAVLAGHVISGAFSGTMFAMIYFLFSENGKLDYE